MSKTAWVNRANYEAWINGEDVPSPFLWEKQSRHANMAIGPSVQPSEPVAWLIEWWNKLTDKWTYFELVEKEPTPSEFGDPNVFRWRPLYLNPPSREHLAASSATCSPTALGSQVGRLRYPGLEREALDHEAMERLRTEGISISRQSEGWFYKAEHHMAGHFYTAADPADAILGGPEDE